MASSVMATPVVVTGASVRATISVVVTHAVAVRIRVRWAIGVAAIRAIAAVISVITIALNVVITDAVAIVIDEVGSIGSRSARVGSSFSRRCLNCGLSLCFNKSSRCSVILIDDRLRSCGKAVKGLALLINPCDQRIRDAVERLDRYCAACKRPCIRGRRSCLGERKDRDCKHCAERNGQHADRVLLHDEAPHSSDGFHYPYIARFLLKVKNHGHRGRFYVLCALPSSAGLLTHRTVPCVPSSYWPAHWCAGSGVMEPASCG